MKLEQIIHEALMERYVNLNETKQLHFKRKCGFEYA